MSTRTSRTFLFLILFAFVARPALAAPGAATLLSPNGDVSGSTIAFSWQAVPESTWYLFYLGTSTALVQQQWYTADQAGCLSGGTCTITLTPPLVSGGYFWYIQTWGGGTSGPWSDAKPFTFRDPTPTWSRSLPDNRRFTLQLNDEAVLDNETGLTWQRTPSAGAGTWVSANLNCLFTAIGGRIGWRLPTVSELSTLAKEGQTPALPAGHPFNLGNTSTSFWSQTLYPDGTDILGVYFSGFNAYSSGPKTGSARNWCVRAPTGSAR